MQTPEDSWQERFRREEASRLGRELGQDDYRAIDPSARYVRCGCGRTDCWTAGLLPLRHHIAALYRAILALGFAERFLWAARQDDPWPGVTYALQMAGGIIDIKCDPSNVDDSEAGFYCESVAEREDEDQELASKYAAALVIFNFVWTAYEAAIEISAQGDIIKDTLPVHARRIFEAERDNASKIASFNQNYGFAKHICERHPELKAKIAATIEKHNLNGPSAAAELVRVYRNYIIHGDENLPIGSVGPCYRSYAITRLVLLLIQHLVYRKVRQPSRLVSLSVNREEVGREPATLFLQNLHYEDAQWRKNMPKRSRFGLPVTRRFID